MVRINHELTIPETELRFSASRGGGPGGQHVNKTASRVTLTFDVQGSPSLSPEQRQRLLEALSNRISREGLLRISAHTTRSQALNRQLLIQRFARLLSAALQRRRPRRPTRPTRSSRERRLREKRRRAEIKRRRGRPGSDAD